VAQYDRIIAVRFDFRSTDGNIRQHLEIAALSHKPKLNELSIQVAKIFIIVFEKGMLLQLYPQKKRNRIVRNYGLNANPE
jgi:hypothetical protein